MVRPQKSVTYGQCAARQSVNSFINESLHDVEDNSQTVLTEALRKQAETPMLRIFIIYYNFSLFSVLLYYHLDD